MIFKYVGTKSAEESIEILNYLLRDGSIRASDPRTFNDPSELKVIYDFNAPSEIIRQRYFLDNRNATQEDYENWVRTFSDQNRRHIAYQNRQNNLNEFGVVSLTSDCEHYLMWSHYARSHTGFCIGFDDGLLASVDDVAYTGTVTYSEEVPVFRYYAQELSDIVEAVFFNKSSCWAYEKEIRIVTSGHGNKKFDNSLVREVTIGCKAPRELDSHARTLIDTNIDVFHMIDLPSKYRLKKEKIKHAHYVEKCAL